MRHRMAVGSVAAALIVLVVAGCGGSAASPSASTAAATDAPAPTEEPVATEAASVAPTEAPTTAGAVKMTARCASVAVRKDPAPDGKLFVRLAKGASVRVVETVTGDPYTAGACGTSGDTWAKIDRVNGKSVKTLYGVAYAYAADGFLK